MDLHQLEIFVAVMDAASVTKAADHVHLTPGAVSLQLQKLAQELDTELFLRSGRNLVPTAAAHRLAEYSRSLLRQINNIHEAFENNPATDTRPFHFATGVTTLIYRLGGPLRKLRKQYPNTEIQVTVSATEGIVKGLLERRFDLGLISLPVADENLIIMPLYDEELLLLRPSSTRVRSQHVESVRPSELADVPFLLYPKHSNMRSIIERHLARVGIVPRVVMEADDTEAIKRLVEAGFGYSMLPEHALRGQAGFFQMLRITNHKLVRRQALAMARTEHPRKLTPSIADLLYVSLTGRRSGEIASNKPIATAEAPVALKTIPSNGNMANLTTHSRARARRTVTAGQ